MLGAIVAVAAALRFYGLENQSLWGDEIASVFLAGSSLSESLGRVQLDVHPPLYFYLLSLWSGLFGTSEFALRMPSVLAGILAVPLTYRVGRRLFGERAGLAAAALLCVSVVEIYYSQEVRSYAFLVLGGLLSMDALTAGWASGRRRHFVYYVLVTTGLLYVHYFGFLLLLAQAAGLGLVWLTAPRSPEGVREKFGFHIGSAAVALGAIALLFLPWLPVLQAQFQSTASSFWIEEVKPLTPLRTLAIFASLQRPPWGWLVPWTQIAWVFAVLLPSFLLLALPRRGAFFPGFDAEETHRTTLPPRAAVLFVLAWLLVPALIALAASWAGTQAYTHRNLLVSSPALFLLLGALFRTLPGRIAPAIFAAAALAPALAQYPWYYGEPHKGEWRELSQALSAEADPADGWVFDVPSIRKNFDFYRGSAPYRFVDMRRRQAPAPDRIWLIRDERRHSGELFPNRLEAWGYRELSRRDFRGVDAHLYERAPRSVPDARAP